MFPFVSESISFSYPKDSLKTDLSRSNRMVSLLLTYPKMKARVRKRPDKTVFKGMFHTKLLLVSEEDKTVPRVALPCALLKADYENTCQNRNVVDKVTISADFQTFCLVKS